MKKTLGLLMLCLTFSFVVQAQSEKEIAAAVEKEVAEAVEKMRKAMINANKAELENIAAEELSYGHSSGKIENKAEFIEALVSGKSDFETIELMDQSIKVAGNTAIVRHKLAGKVKDNGKPGNVNLGVLLIWQNQNGEWKLLARQAFKL